MNDWAAQVRDALARLARFWTGLPPGRRAQLAVAGVLTLALVGGFVWRVRQVAYRPLYTGLSAAEAGAIVARLEQRQTPYRLAAGGSTILAPEHRIDELRLNLAADGLPRTGRQGFEIFDKNNFGATEFAEQINFRRALEGELERTIGSLVEVESARVHLSLPRRSVFLSQDRPAKASVVLEMAAGRALSEERTRAVANLVASAVEGLDPERVVVMDHLGRLFARRSGGGDAELTERQLEYRSRVEAETARKIVETLEPYLGPGGMRVNVAVEVDWDSGEQTEEVLDPSPVAMSVQRSEERSNEPAPAGAPGAVSNLPREPATVEMAAAAMSRTVETTNYQTSRSVTRMQLERGSIERMSIAVLVDQQVHADEAAGKLVRRPRQESELEVLRELVVAASGAVAARGDTVTVHSLPFHMLEDPPRLPPPPPDPADELFTMEWLERYRLHLIAGLAGLLLLTGLFFWWRRRRAKIRVRLERERALAAERERLALEAAEKEKQEMQRLEEERLLKGLKIAPAPSSRTVALKKHLEQLADEDPALFARIIKTWIHEDD